MMRGASTVGEPTELSVWGMVMMSTDYHDRTRYAGWLAAEGHSTPYCAMSSVTPSHVASSM